MVASTAPARCQGEVETTGGVPRLSRVSALCGASAPAGWLSGPGGAARRSPFLASVSVIRREVAAGGGGAAPGSVLSEAAATALGLARCEKHGRM
eukprot:9909209-Heterocapsa_arctica.AAC.1